MDEYTKTFREWMDRHKLRAADVAADLFVTEQAIRNWRSAGVPARRRDHLAQYMSEKTAQIANIQTMEGLRQTILLVETTPEEYRNWEKAAAKASKPIGHWAHDALEEAADELYSSARNELRSVKAAEPTQENVYSAKDGDTSQPDKKEQSA